MRQLGLKTLVTTNKFVINLSPLVKQPGVPFEPIENCFGNIINLLIDQEN